MEMKKKRGPCIELWRTTQSTGRHSDVLIISDTNGFLFVILDCKQNTLASRTAIIHILFWLSVLEHRLHPKRTPKLAGIVENWFLLGSLSMTRCWYLVAGRPEHNQACEERSIFVCKKIYTKKIRFTRWCWLLSFLSEHNCSIWKRLITFNELEKKALLRKLFIAISL